MCSRYRYFRDEQKHNNISFDICVWIATIPGMLIVVLYTRIPPVHICHVEDKVYEMMYICTSKIKLLHFIRRHDCCAHFQLGVDATPELYHTLSA